MSSRIFTASGATIDPLHPAVADIRLSDVAHHLSRLCRWNGATREVYTVAQHSLLTCAMLYHVDREFFMDPVCQLLALLHDGAEAYLGDLATPIKHTTALAPFREYEARLQEAVEYRLIVEEVPRSTTSSLEPYRDAVKEADTLSLVFEAKHTLCAPQDLTYLLPPGTELPSGGAFKVFTPSRSKRQFLEHYFSILGETRVRRGR